MFRSTDLLIFLFQICFNFLFFIIQNIFYSCVMRQIHVYKFPNLYTNVTFNRNFDYTCSKEKTTLFRRITLFYENTELLCSSCVNIFSRITRQTHSFRFNFDFKWLKYIFILSYKNETQYSGYFVLIYCPLL